MIDRWAQILKTIEPNIELLKMSLEHGVDIKIDLKQNNRGAWQIKFYSYWLGVDVDQNNYLKEFNLDERIEWAVEELEKWSAWRSSYDTWVFSNKDEAEKFLTYYTLKWAR